MSDRGSSYSRAAGAFNDWRREPGILTVFVETEGCDPDVGTVYRDLTRDQAERLLEELTSSLEKIDERRLTPEEADALVSPRVGRN